ncbi:MAG: hypothetical protein J5905_06180 [Prevotella sp.]|nr:hypothetical protein [Prevotella sp.]
MNNQLNFNAVMAWTAFGAQDYLGLEQYGGQVYNYFVHNPKEIFKLDSPLLIGKVFQVCLGFQEPDEDIQEVRAENAFLCFSQALKSDKSNVHDEASARLMMLLIRDQSHLKNKVEHACQNEHANPYSIFGMIDNGMPNDMPMAVNTKMLFTAYYLYDCIIDKANVSSEFVNAGERKAYENVKIHVLDNCCQLQNTSSERKAELGGIVFEKICKRLRKDIELYSNNM